MSDWAERDAAVVWHGFTQMSCYADNAPIVVERAEGRELIDVDGNRYLDAISSLWVTTLGHRVPELDAAVRDQLDRVAHSTMLGNGNRVVIELAEALAGVVPVRDPHFLFASDGAAAVEQALKIAFQHWTNLGVPGRTRYLALGGAYHGDTIGSLSVGAGGFGTDVFDPLRFPVLRGAGYETDGWLDDALALLDAHAAELAAVVVEPLVQGAAGIEVADPHDLATLAAACRAHDVLLICDEVATGFGRTGTLFASEQCGIQPDLMCLGKGITGGYLPMSATVATGRVYESFLGPDLGERTLYHGHSYGGNALAAAVAVRHLRLIEEWDVLPNVTARAAQLADLLAGRMATLPAKTEVRQRGLMCGVELLPPEAGLRWGRRVCAAAVRRGVLLRPLGDVVVLMPPLTVTAAEIDRIVDALCDAITEVCGVTLDAVADTTATTSWTEHARQRNEATRAAGRWRTIRELDALGTSGVLSTSEGVSAGPVVSFASNDYLGMTAHPAVVAAAHDALDRWGTGSGASRLVTGARPVHRELETELADWKGTEAALLFPTGFAANLGVLTTLAGPGVTVCSDELNHASIIDGCRLARAGVTVFRHRDVDHLTHILGGIDGPALVVTDSVFSMDGDEAPLTDLASVCRRHGALLVLDEAHAVLGPEAAELECEVIRVGTLSKALGSLGGFAAASRPVIELLLNEARPFIFTTAPTPADTAAALAALRVLRDPEGAALMARLRGHVERVAPGHPSPIVPVVIGDEQATVAASDALLAQGIFVPAIRPPTVAPGTSRLRVALSAAHTDDEIDRLVAGLRGVHAAA